MPSMPTGPEGKALVVRLGVQPTDLPILICPNGTVLRRPSDAEAGVFLRQKAHAVLAHVGEVHGLDRIAAHATGTGKAISAPLWPRKSRIRTKRRHTRRPRKSGL